MSYKKLTIDQDDLYYEIATMNPNASKLAYKAIAAKLYVRDWNLIDDLINIHQTPDDVEPEGIIVLCEYNGVAIGVAVQMRWLHREFFVRGKYRRNGIASKMNQFLNNESSLGQKFYGKPGRMDCVDFFKKINVELR